MQHNDGDFLLNTPIIPRDKNFMTMKAKQLKKELEQKKARFVEILQQKREQSMGDFLLEKKAGQETKQKDLDKYGMRDANEIIDKMLSDSEDEGLPTENEDEKE